MKCKSSHGKKGLNLNYSFCKSLPLFQMLCLNVLMMCTFYKHINSDVEGGDFIGYICFEKKC